MGVVEGDSAGFEGPAHEHLGQMHPVLGAGVEIALRLGISRYTVKDHRKHIFRKLSVGSLAELFALHRRA